MRDLKFFSRRREVGLGLLGANDPSLAIMYRMARLFDATIQSLVLRFERSLFGFETLVVSRTVVAFVAVTEFAHRAAPSFSCGEISASR